MKKKIVSLLLLLVMTAGLCACAPEEPVMPQPKQTAAVAERPKPGDDFYEYVNYDFLTKAQVPYDSKSYTRMDQISKELENDIYSIVDRCCKEGKTAEETQIKTLYEQYTDTDAREAAGVAPLMPITAMIEKCKTTDELISAMGMLYQEYGVSSFFNFEIKPDMADTSINRLYLFRINTMGNMKENFTKTDKGIENIGDIIKNTISIIDEKETNSLKRTQSAVSIVNDIVYAMLDSKEEYNIEKHYKLYSRDQLKKMFKNINVDLMIKSFGFSEDKIIVYDEGSAKKVDELFTSENLRALKDYTLACAMYTYGDALPPSSQEGFSYLANKEKELQRKGKMFIYDNLPEELGIIYGKEICTDEVMNMADKMLKDISKSCRELIQNSSRFSGDSKKKLTEKLDNIIFLVGYNKDYHTPYDLLPKEKGGTLIGNLISIKKYNVKLAKKKLSKKADRSTWGLTPITVDAVYSPLSNTVTIPAAMLSKAAFDPELGEYKNLGMLGHVIAHEINHAFDSLGINFDKNGCYNPEFIRKADRDAYKILQKRVIDYYQNYKILGIYSIDGEKTLAENIADIGAIECLVNITDNKENIKQILEGEAQEWAALTEITDVLTQLESNEHSPGEARVNAVVSSVDKFYEVYDIKESDKMYVAPENRIKVW